MALSTLQSAFYYLLGGVTFVPLCAAALLLHFVFFAPVHPSALGTPLPPLSARDKLAALDLARSNEALEKKAASAGAATLSGATAPPAARRLGPPPPAPPARPHRAGWLVVRRTFGGDSPALLLAAAAAAPAAPPAAAASRAEGSAAGDEARAGEAKQGYIGAVYRGVLNYRLSRAQKAGAAASSSSNAGAGDDAARLAPQAVSSSRSSSPGRPASSAASSAAPAAGPVRESFHAILKGSVLFLYSSADASSTAIDCVSAIDLRGKRVSLYIAHAGDTAGEPDDLDGAAYQQAKASQFDTPATSGTEDDGAAAAAARSRKNWARARRAAVRDGELFTKRNAIRIVSPAAGGARDKFATRDEYFVFAKSASDLEDWYHALLHASLLHAAPHAGAAQDGLPEPVREALGEVFEPLDMVRLLTSLDTLPDPIPLRWLNALLGRMFFSIYRTAWLEDYVTRKIMKKMARVRTPGYLGDIRVREVDLGRAPPAFSRPMLKSLTGEGEASMEVAIHYTGAIRLTISTVLTISLGSRFKPYTVNLLLAVVINSLSGNLLLHIKPPPSNRLWFGFTQLPTMDISVEPVVSERKVQWSMVKRLIEGRIRELLTESLVVPNMDDIPFFDTRPLEHRGGIWADAVKRAGDDAAAAAPTEEAEPAEEPAAASAGLGERRGSAPASTAGVQSSGAQATARATARDVPTGDGSLRNRRTQPAGAPELLTAVKPMVSTSPSSPAMAGLSSLLARDQAANASSAGVSPSSSLEAGAEGGASRAASVRSVPVGTAAPSKRRSWFVRAPATQDGEAPPLPALPGQTRSGAAKGAPKSSLAWGNASLATSAEAQERMGAAERSSLQVPAARAQVQRANSHEKNKESISSISSVDTEGSGVSVDTEQLNDSLEVAVDGLNGEFAHLSPDAVSTSSEEASLAAEELRRLVDRESEGTPQPAAASSHVPRFEDERSGTPRGSTFEADASERSAGASRPGSSSTTASAAAPASSAESKQEHAASFAPAVSHSPLGVTPVEEHAPELPQPSTRTARTAHGFAPPPRRSAPSLAPSTAGSTHSSDNAVSTGGLTALHRERYGMATSPAREEASYIRQSDTRSSTASSSQQAVTASAMFNKARNVMADKDSRQAAAKEARDALKRGWAGWNAKRHAGTSSSAAPQQQQPSPSSFEAAPSLNPAERAAAWLAREAPDLPGMGFERSRHGHADAPRPTQDEHIRGRERLDAAIGGESAGSSRQSSRSTSSERPTYKDYRERRKRPDSSQTQPQAQPASAPSAPHDAAWDAPVASLAPPARVAHREEGESPSGRSSGSIRRGGEGEHGLAVPRSPIQSNAKPVAPIVPDRPSPQSLSPAVETAPQRTGAAELPSPSELDSMPATPPAPTSSIFLDSSPRPLLSNVPDERRASNGSIGSPNSASSPNKAAAAKIKTQPGRASMMMVPGIPTAHRAEPQSFSAPPPPPSAPAQARAPFAAFKMPFGKSANAPGAVGGTSSQLSPPSGMPQEGASPAALLPPMEVEPPATSSATEVHSESPAPQPDAAPAPVHASEPELTQAPSEPAPTAPEVANLPEPELKVSAVTESAAADEAQTDARDVAATPFGGTGTESSQLDVPAAASPSTAADAESAAAELAALPDVAAAQPATSSLAPSDQQQTPAASDASTPATSASASLAALLNEVDHTASADSATRD